MCGVLGTSGYVGKVENAEADVDMEEDASGDGHDLDVGSADVTDGRSCCKLCHLA